jgi:hypothetical protein
MAGQIKRMIDTIVSQRSKGNATIAVTTRTKLLLKGINPDNYTAASPDDAVVMAKLQGIANDFGVFL